jgi:hypothetical protein
MVATEDSVTTVPLPDVSLHRDGAVLREIYRLGPIVPNHGVSLAAATYRGTVHLGLLTDPGLHEAIGSPPLSPLPPPSCTTPTPPRPGRTRTLHARRGAAIPRRIFTHEHAIGVPTRHGRTLTPEPCNTALRGYRRTVHRTRNADQRLPVGTRARARPTLVRRRRTHHRRGRAAPGHRPRSALDRSSPRRQARIAAQRAPVTSAEEVYKIASAATPADLTCCRRTGGGSSGSTRSVDQVIDLAYRSREAARTWSAGGDHGSQTERVRAAVVDGRGPQAGADRPDREEPGPDAPRDRGLDVRPGPDRPGHHVVAAGQRRLRAGCDPRVQRAGVRRAGPKTERGTPEEDR